MKKYSFFPVVPYDFHWTDFTAGRETIPPELFQLRLFPGFLEHAPVLCLNHFLYDEVFRSLRIHATNASTFSFSD
jgi:hypothetical protein